MDCLTEAYKTTKFGNLYRFNVTSGRRMESFEGKKKQFSFSTVIMACSFRLAHSIDLLYYISEQENMGLIIDRFFLAFVALRNREIWCTLLRDLIQISAYYLLAEYRSDNRTP